MFWDAPYQSPFTVSLGIPGTGPWEPQKSVGALRSELFGLAGNEARALVWANHEVDPT
jgi:hypothetical protein